MAHESCTEDARPFKEIEKAQREKRKAQVPIWRCAVCGRADLPYIVCHVSPYIVRYIDRDVDEGPQKRERERERVGEAFYFLLFKKKKNKKNKKKG